MKNNILVIGGTGKTGRKIVSQLTEKGHNVRIGSRNAVPRFDWQDESTWATALSGMRKVYITFQPDLAVPGALEAIEALMKVAVAQQIGKVVLLSGKGEKEAELCEQAVIHSGIDYTVIRASWFNQNFSESFFLDPIKSGHVALPKPDAKVPYVDTNDIAEVAVEALIDEQHNGKLYELTGPRLLTFKEVVGEIARATGRKIRYTPISMTAYTRMLQEAGVPGDYVWLIGYLFNEVLGTEGNDTVTGDIEAILGRPPKDFTDFAIDTAKTGVWSEHIVESI